jgi:hypothetical protein
MKFITFILMSFLSLSAFSFSEVTINRDVTLKNRVNEDVYEVGSLSIEGDGSNFCYVSLSSKNLERTLVKAGTVFETVQVTDEHCEWVSFSERACLMSITAQNRELELNLSVTCKELGLFVTSVTAKSAIKDSKGFMTLK